MAAFHSPLSNQMRNGCLPDAYEKIRSVFWSPCTSSGPLGLDSFVWRAQVRNETIEVGPVPGPVS